MNLDAVMDLRNLATDFRDEIRGNYEDDEGNIAPVESWSEEDQRDFAILRELADDLGVTHNDDPLALADNLEHQGDYCEPVLIADWYFEDYAQELADDLGLVRSDARWPNNCIDWAEAASELQQDYTSVKIDGHDYWIRSYSCALAFWC